MSPVKLDSTCVRFSRSMPACRLPISSWLHMTSLVMRTPNGLLPTISSAVSQRGVDDGAVGHDARHEPDPVGFGRVDEAAGEHQLERARRADEARQHPRDADVAAREPDADERDVEARASPRRCARRSRARARARRPTPAPLTAAMIGCGIDRIFGTRPAMIFCTVMPACARPSPRRASAATRPR